MIDDNVLKRGAMFEVTLSRVQDAEIWRSEGADENEYAARLQQLFDDNVDDGQAYAKELAKLKQEGHEFRLTEGKVFELFPSDKHMQVPIKLQIKEGTITWYFVAPHDVTKQTFRDEVYRSAALAHLNVENACEKYLRGTNALHVKKMHTSEEESGLNHNHYRLLEGHDVTPEDLRQHLMGFVKAERELGLLTEESGHRVEKFLDQEEAEKIINAYEKQWIKINHVGEEKDVMVGEEKVHLPKRDKSLLDEFKARELSKWTDEDWAEWNEYKELEQPCRSIDPSLPLAERLAAAEKGMRGLRSEAAHTRQMEGSRFKVLKTKYQMDDAVAKIDIPKGDEQNELGSTKA